MLFAKLHANSSLDMIEVFFVSPELEGSLIALPSIFAQDHDILLDELEVHAYVYQCNI